LRKQSLTVTEHLEVDDSDVLFHVKQWQRSDDAILSDLSRRFTNRRLFKAIDLDMPEPERPGFLAAARECVERAGYDPEYYFIEDRASDVPYYNYYTAAGAEPKSRIYVEDGYARPRIREITEVSEVVRGLQRGYELHRVCFPAEVKTEVYKLYHELTPADRLAVGRQ
jgi:HD superfamily phosphohydrolase